MDRKDIERRLKRANPFSEESLEMASMLHFHDMGWECEHAEHEAENENQSILGRRDFNEVILKRHLLPKLKELNPDQSNESIDEAVRFLERDRSRMSIPDANREIYLSLKEGIPVQFRDPSGNIKSTRIKVIDWNSPKRNHFLVVSQLWVRGDHYRRRPDLIGFVNGLPLLLVEYKSPDKNVIRAYEDNLSDYKDTIPKLFWYNAFCILSNGIQSKIGSITSGWEHFSEWKKVDSEKESPLTENDSITEGTCNPERFLDIVENFTIYIESQGGLIKIVPKNHQYLGVKNVMSSMANPEESKKLGVFWHTQGSGKSISMVFFCQKVLRKMRGNWTFLIVTDRTELDTQIYKNFKNSGTISESQVQAESIKHLRELLGEDHRYVFTLIHKFQQKDGARHPVLSERDNIIVITDEAHRSQYDLLAQNMREALPNAKFLGFTGTPLISSSQEKTKDVFGDYVSVYNFTQSIEDKATVPLFYENRLPKVEMKNEHFTEELNEIIDQSGINEKEEDKLERQFSKMHQLITRDDRLDKIAEDAVKHFFNRGHRGKGMFVCIDRRTAIKMYEKVNRYKKEYEKKLEAEKSVNEAKKDLYEYVKAILT